MKFINEYEKTGLLAVDMVASIVSHYRNHALSYKRSLKTIYLSPKQFVQFQDWVRHNQSEEDAEKEVEMYLFDGVEVKMNSVIMGEKVYFDFYEKEELVEA